ncbi:MAG: hypothetical protein ACI936_000306 [Paraglaciecola sp.]|jgi:hypothetical protein
MEILMKNAMYFVVILAVFVFAAFYFSHSEVPADNNQSNGVKSATKLDENNVSVISSVDREEQPDSSIIINKNLPLESLLTLDEKNTEKVTKLKVKIDALIFEMDQKNSYVDERARIKQEMSVLLDEYNQLILPTALKEIEKTNLQ